MIVTQGGNMKSCFMSLLFWIIITKLVLAIPLMEFPEGKYLGEGKYMVSNGMEGSYSSFLDLDNSQWKLFYLRNGEQFIYSVSLQFLTLGFFEAYMDKYNKEGLLASYPGYGYCISKLCHFYFDLSDKFIEETIFINPLDHKIQRLGSLKYIDENDAEQRIAWNEVLVKIDNGDL